MKMIRINFSIPSDMDKVLTALAKRYSISKSAFIRASLINTFREEYEADTLQNNKEER